MVNAINANAANSATQANLATSNATPARPEAKSATGGQTPAQPQPAAKAPTDTVQISSAALALQEAVETPAQTAKEAGHGDHQAQRLLAKEAAAAKAEG